MRDKRSIAQQGCIHVSLVRRLRQDRTCRHTARAGVEGTIRASRLPPSPPPPLPSPSPAYPSPGRPALPPTVATVSVSVLRTTKKGSVFHSLSSAVEYNTAHPPSPPTARATCCATRTPTVCSEAVAFIDENARITLESVATESSPPRGGLPLFSGPLLLLPLIGDSIRRRARRPASVARLCASSACITAIRGSTQEAG